MQIRVNKIVIKNQFLALYIVEAKISCLTQQADVYAATKSYNHYMPELQEWAGNKTDRVYDHMMTPRLEQDLQVCSSRSVAIIGKTS